MKNIFKLTFYSLLAGQLFISSCKKYLEIPLPNDQLAVQTAFSSKATIELTVNGLYNALAATSLCATNIRTSYWISDEAVFSTIPGGDFGALMSGNFSANIYPFNAFMPWTDLYKTIYRANLLLENLPGVASSVLTDTEKKQYTASALFSRAYMNFLLVSSWGDVPLITSTSVDKNSILPRTPAAEVYASIINDLQTAMANLPTTVGDARFINNKYQPEALLARVYLYLGKWAEAEAAATDIINSSKYQLVSNLNDVFKRGTQESIFSMAEVTTSSLAVNRAYIGWLSLPYSQSLTVTTYAHLTDELLNSFEAGDQRAVSGNWTTTLFGFKFPFKYWHNATASAATVAANPQDFIAFRYAEQFLIRAEARAQQNNISNAAADINVIRTRAGLSNTTANDKTSLLTAVENERRHELFCEGHRWYDLVRTGRADAVLGALPWKSANWKPTNKLFPIFYQDLIANPNLTQNPGY